MANKKYKCPYCEYRGEKEKLIMHIEKVHEDMIPQGQTPAQVVFNTINKKTHGTCVVCGKNTKWNEKNYRYDRLCENPKCREAMRNKFKENAMKKHGTYNFAKDPKFQEKMLKGRKISSTYKFSDGGKVDYVGSYEKKFLEFLDKVMEIDSKDIIGPGPIIEYIYNGKIHYWITDFYYVPGDLVLDIKDGGKNPNTRPMEEYREKQIAKEDAIRKMRKYNYLRLTDNDFSQFMEVLADLKMMNLDIKEKKIITKINESTIEEYVSAIPPLWSTNANVMVTSNIKGEKVNALSSLDDNEYVLIDDDEKGIKKITKDKFKKEYKIKDQFLYKKNDKYEKLLNTIKNNTDDIYKGIYYNLSSFDNIFTEEQIYFDKEFKKLKNKGIDDNVFNTAKNINKLYSVLQLDIGDESIGVTLPKIDLDSNYEIESILKNGKPTTRIKLDNSVIATFNKTAEELNIKDYENIQEVVDILNTIK